MKAVEVILKKEKATKNTIKYSTDAEVPIPVLYVNKNAFEGEVYPQQIKVTVTEG